jgi:hypothetical protein
MVMDTAVMKGANVEPDMTPMHFFAEAVSLKKEERPPTRPLASEL